MFVIYLFFFSFRCFSNLSVSDIFLFLYRIFLISFYFQSCDLWDLVFVHLFFLFSYPYFLTSNINVIFHGSIDHTYTITSYVSIVMKFVTFNVTWGHIDIYFLTIYFIIPAICNLMSKVNTIKTMCWQELQLAQFAQDLFLSLMSNFKMPKGEFVGQFAQAPWISLHRHSLNFGDRQFLVTPGVSISGFWEFLFRIFAW
jgi:hypothetical protein